MPFSDTILKYLFHVVDETDGGSRTLKMSFAKKQGKEGPYLAIAGSVYRQVVDLGDPQTMHLAHDMGNIQSPLQGEFRTDFHELFKDGYYFPMSTSPQYDTDAIKETGDTFYLH